jgi:hypothetical protein
VEGKVPLPVARFPDQSWEASFHERPAKIMTVTRASTDASLQPRGYRRKSLAFLVTVIGTRAAAE